MTPIVSEHKLPKMRFDKKQGGPLKGVAYDVTIYVYPDGHVNIANLGDIEQNYVAANRDEAMAAFERMLDLAAEQLAGRLTQAS